MIQRQRNIQIICADPILTQQYLTEMEQSRETQSARLAQSAAEARKNFLDSDPSVILLDESAVEPGGTSLEFTVAMLTETAPIVVVAAAERQAELSFLIASGAADFVARSGHFVTVAAGLVERRIQLADCATGLLDGELQEEDFGEILRHEVNNPLTGILGNAELLLARRDHLPPAAVARVETIAELAVRLRETVRRLSSAWTLRNDHVSSS